MVVKVCMRESCRAGFREGEEAFEAGLCTTCGAPLYEETIGEVDDKYKVSEFKEDTENIISKDKEEVSNKKENEGDIYYIDNDNNIHFYLSIRTNNSLIDNLTGPRILVYEGPIVKDIIPIEYDETIIGRSSINGEPDIDLTDIDSERLISRKHALIYLKDTNYYIRRLSTKNSLHVNKKVVFEEDEQLNNEDIIVLSRKFALEFRV